MLTSPDQTDASLNVALRIIDDAWNELRLSPYVQLRMSISPTRLPDISFAEAERRSEVGRSLLRRLDMLDLSALPHDLTLTLRLVRFRARVWSREAEWYWTVIDPCGIGSFGMFLATAYCGGYLLNLIHNQLASFSFRGAGDDDRYLALVADYGRLIKQFATRTAGQVERGIRMPKVQVQQARVLLQAFKSSAAAVVGVAPHRLIALRTSHFANELNHRIATCIEPAFDRALEGLSGAYVAEAPESVGISQYPGGAALYAELVKLHTTLELTPEEVHARGLLRMAELEESMRAIRSQLGFNGEGAAFLAHLNESPQWRVKTVEGVVAVFQRYIDRLKPHLNEFFSIIPKASYAVAPLPEALQKSMTFGTYDPPRDNRREGLYLFNSENLTQGALFHVAAVTYHELMPGHHLQIAMQQENSSLHPFRMHGLVNAYNEGWAEYAASALAWEIGLYEQPEERYGRLMFDAFLTSRLVVDTGMNVLGWSLERARDYMRAHSGLAEAEIFTELLRYSCDRPGQALAYKLGDTQILAMRERMRRALGVHFELKEFHAAVLGPGALPLPDLDWHIDHEIKRLKVGDCRSKQMQ